MMLLNPYRFAAGGGAPSIGDTYGGGIYIGDLNIGGTDYRIVMATASSSLYWKTTATDTPGAGSLTDGLANTAAMEAAGIALHPAAEYCVNYAGGSFTDWYLPARDELLLAYTNRALLATLALPSGDYWTSSQSAAVGAYFMNLPTGAVSGVYKTNSLITRPVRRVAI